MIFRHRNQEKASKTLRGENVYSVHEFAEYYQERMQELGEATVKMGM